MGELLQVRCPECDLILYVSRSTGKVVETRRPEAESLKGEDRFDALVRKVKSRGDVVLEKYEKAREQERNKFERLDALFKESTKRIQEEGDTGRAVKDIDLD